MNTRLMQKSYRQKITCLECHRKSSRKLTPECELEITKCVYCSSVNVLTNTKKDCISSLIDSCDCLFGSKYKHETYSNISVSQNFSLNRDQKNYYLTSNF